LPTDAFVSGHATLSETIAVRDRLLIRLCEDIPALLSLKPGAAAGWECVPKGGVNRIGELFRLQPTPQTLIGRDFSFSCLIGMGKAAWLVALAPHPVPFPPLPLI
jgi:hypothetical protein